MRRPPSTELLERPALHREKVLVAVPVIGIEGGGLGERRGEVLKGQLEVCVELARHHGIDIAVVTPDRAVYGAAPSTTKT